MGVPFTESWVPSPMIVSQTTGSGAVLMDTATGDCFELNAVGAEVWDQLSRGAPLVTVIDALERRYALPRAVLEADVSRLVEDLARRGIVKAAKNE